MAKTPQAAGPGKTRPNVTAAASAPFANAAWMAPSEFEAVIRRHPHVVRFLAGHHQRPIQALFAGTLAMVAPSVAHQVVLDLVDRPPAPFNFEPAAFHLHLWTEGAGLISHTAYVEKAAGRYPFLRDADYPGA